MNIRLYHPISIEENSTSLLSKEHTHYVVNVMRLKRGSQINFFNKTGEWKSEIIFLDKDRVEIKILEKVKQSMTSSNIELAICLVKKNPMETILQKATELGVSKIIPIVSERTEVKELNFERANKIVVEATEQSNQLTPPEISKVIKLKDFIDTAQYDRLSLDIGLLSSELSSLLTLSQEERAPVFLGAVILEDRSTPISGIQTTDEFTIQSTDASGNVRSVTITMSDISSDVNDYTLDNIATHVNDKLVDAGIATSLKVERHSETRFGFSLNIGFDETVTVSSNSNESESVYVAGIRGEDKLGSGYLAKIDNLDATDPDEVFFNQIDTVNAGDRAEAVAVDSNGDVYVVGTTEGDLGDQKVDPVAKDMFLQKYDAAGNLLFTRRLGAPFDGTAFSVKVDANDNVFVAGQVHGLLDANGHGGNYDTFVSKYDKNGIEVFTRQLAPFADDGAFSMSLNTDGDIFLAGFTKSAIAPDKVHGGNSDAYITKLDNNGNLIYNRQLGGFAAQNDTRPFIQKRKVKLFFNLSSMAVYGRPIESIINEKSNHSQIDLLAICKLFIEKAFETELSHCVNLRLPGILCNSFDSNRPWLNTIIYKIKKNIDVKIYNGEKNFNNLIDTYEIFNFINFVIEKKIKIQGTYNLAASKPVKLISLIKVIKLYFDSDSKILNF